MKCPHCKGTGEAPGKIKLECISCQCSVTVTYTSTSELIEKSKDVLCPECKKLNAAIAASLSTPTTGEKRHD